MSKTGHENLEERLLHRLLFFSDAVFAIVLTLLVLELRPPEGAVSPGGALLDLSGHLVAFAMSFALISVFWLAHMNSTRRLAHFDWPTAIANLLFLFPICLLPFASAWLGHSFNLTILWGVYSGILIASSAGNVLLVLVMSRGGGRLMAGGMTGRERLYRLMRAASAGLAFLVSILVMLSGHIHVAQFCAGLVGVFFWLAELLFKPRVEPQPETT
jgi:uncharacterized membrane protein